MEERADGRWVLASNRHGMWEWERFGAACCVPLNPRSDTSRAGEAHHLPPLTGREVEEEGAVVLPGLLNEAHRLRRQHICRCGGRLWDALWDACRLHVQCTGAAAVADRQMAPVQRGVLKLSITPCGGTALRNLDAAPFKLLISSQPPIPHR